MSSGLYVRLSSLTCLDAETVRLESLTYLEPLP